MEYDYRLKGRVLKLLVDLPIDSKHGATKGAEFIITHQGPRCRGQITFFNDSNGLKCGAYSGEWKMAKEQQ